MARYSNLLFIGARGHYKDDSFEILGRGDLAHTLTEVADPEDSDDIGQTFYSHEYYCLTNRGETWYLNLDDEEVYYVETPSPRELQQAGLTQFAEKLTHPFLINPQAPTPTFEAFRDTLGLSASLHLIEGGVGRLQGGEGRAAKDGRLWNYFIYFDFHYRYQNYSVDLFPDGSVEWFRLQKLPKNKLPYIFKDSLRLQNRENNRRLRNLFLVRTLRNLSLGSAVLAFILLFSVGGLNRLLTGPAYTETRDLPEPGERLQIPLPSPQSNFTRWQEIKLEFSNGRPVFQDGRQTGTTHGQDYILVGEVQINPGENLDPFTSSIDLLIETNNDYDQTARLELGQNPKVTIAIDSLTVEDPNVSSSVSPNVTLTLTPQPLTPIPFVLLLFTQTTLAIIFLFMYQYCLETLFKSTTSK